ncbi:MAG: N-acetylmuramoyl-L-alanine amidase [Bacteroidales bacterium]|nr:N-acetylmuramoyl-L-alanine amidase [Bacteroidales bacterium]
MAFPAVLTAQSDTKLALKTVCIDPGHGGHDAGCVSRDSKKTREKDIALSIALKLRDKIRAAYPGVKVVMTRSDDRFIPLNDRAAIANKNNADLFISIHIDATTNNTANGHSVHVLGQSSNKNRDLFRSNMELTRRENSVILLEDDYTTKYQGFDPSDPESFIFFNLMQNAHLEHSLDFAAEVDKALGTSKIPRSRGVRQNPFLVLWRTTMPAVLVECGFISNAGDLEVFRSDAGKNSIAEGLFKAFVAFKNKYDNSLKSGGAIPVEARREDPKREDIKPAAPEVKPVAVEEEAPVSGVYYGTQILASGRRRPANDSFFKGHKPKIIWTGRLYKYVVGVSDSLSEARKKNDELQKFFPDSFVVKVDGENVEIVK